MAYPSTIGKHVKVGSVVAENNRWEGNWGGRLAEVTTSSSGNGTAYAPVRRDPQWSITFPLDDPNYPEVIGFDFGLVLGTVVFIHSTKCDILTNTTVASVVKSIDPLTDVPRVTVSGQGGTLAVNQTIPS